MFPLPISTWIMIALSVAALGGLGYGKYESAKYDAYKAEVVAAGKAQEEHNTAIVKQQDIISKGVKDEYEAKLAAVRNFYSSGVQHPSSRTVPGISAAPKGTDAETAYPILAGQCTETTVQLTSLQDWINQQIGVK
jgi:hypothetical protein